LCNSGLEQGAVVLDPWNGSGTTTTAAAMSGFRAIGFDINPVSITLSKGRLFSQGDAPSVEPLTVAILDSAMVLAPTCPQADPLGTWFSSATARILRGIERALRILLVDAGQNPFLPVNVEDMSNLAAFFYIALFRTVRAHLGGFKLSNPTWIKKHNGSDQIAVSPDRIFRSFHDQVRVMIECLKGEAEATFISSQEDIRVASSEKLPLDALSVDLVLSSPPYCTRIDYGVATLPELATLGIDVGPGLRDLRDQLIGTPTINGRSGDWRDCWGKTCLSLLQQIKDHSSRASESYYLKTHVQYFDAIAKSLAEISRCLRRGAACFLVVQDSFYKDIYNDLPMIFQEMAVNQGLTPRHRKDFKVNRTLAGIHAHSKRYRTTFAATESVLCFVNEA